MKTIFIDLVYMLLILLVILVIMAFIMSAIKVFGKDFRYKRINDDPIPDKTEQDKKKKEMCIKSIQTHVCPHCCEKCAWNVGDENEQ